MGRRRLDRADVRLTGAPRAGAIAAAAGGALLVVSELFDWIDGRSAWGVFHGLDVALLLLGLAASALAALTIAAPGWRPPFVPAHALTACGAILTTIVLIFLDTGSARVGAFLGLLASVAVLGGGLVLGAGGGRPRVDAPPPSAPATTPPPGWYPDPHGEARLRYWDGGSWSDAMSD